jgi:hypothetical protein
MEDQEEVLLVIVVQHLQQVEQVIHHQLVHHKETQEEMPQVEQIQIMEEQEVEELLQQELLILLQVVEQVKQEEQVLQ